MLLSSSLKIDRERAIRKFAYSLTPFVCGTSHLRHNPSFADLADPRGVHSNLKSTSVMIIFI